MKDQLVQEIMQLGMRVNKETDYCVFIYYSGHVDKLSIDISKSKTDYNDFLDRKGMYLDGRSTMDILGEWKEMLQEYLVQK